MRKPVKSSPIIAAVVLAGATAMLYQRNQKTTADLNETRAAGIAARSTTPKPSTPLPRSDSLSTITIRSGGIGSI
jgi:hypothetical protein